MRTVLGRAVLLSGLLTAVALVDGAEAQSMFATRGLGFPLQPQDARYHALGGAGLGLPGAEINWANPAASVGLQRRAESAPATRRQIGLQRIYAACRTTINIGLSPGSPGLARKRP